MACARRTTSARGISSACGGETRSRGVPLLFWDASALVKRYIAEVGRPTSAIYLFTRALASQKSRGTPLLLVSPPHADDIPRADVVLRAHAIGDHQLSGFLGSS